MYTISLDGESLSIEQVVAVAEGTPGEPAVELSPEAVRKVRHAQQAVADLIARGEIAPPLNAVIAAY